MSRLPQDERERIQSRRFDVADSLLYSAVVASYVEAGYSLKLADKALGLVQTEPLMFPADENRDMWTQALAGVKYRWRRRVTARIKDGAVRLSYVFEWERKGQYYGESGWEVAETDTSFSNQFYRNSFSNIAKFLGEEK
jgi:hypothetical protein